MVRVSKPRAGMGLEFLDFDWDSTRIFLAWIESGRESTWASHDVRGSRNQAGFFRLGESIKYYSRTDQALPKDSTVAPFA